MCTFSILLNHKKYCLTAIAIVIVDIERIDYIRISINAVRNDLPEGALEEERKSIKSRPAAGTGELDYPEYIQSGSD